MRKTNRVSVRGVSGKGFCLSVCVCFSVSFSVYSLAQVWSDGDRGCNWASWLYVLPTTASRCSVTHARTHAHAHAHTHKHTHACAECKGVVTGWRWLGFYSFDVEEDEGGGGDGKITVPIPPRFPLVKSSVFNTVI